MTTQIDATDRQLLRELQKDSHRSVQVLGEVVGLSPSACHRRIKMLEEEGYVARYRAELDPALLGYTMQVFVAISLLSQDEDLGEQFEAAVRDVPEVLDCFRVAGGADYSLRVVCRGHEEFGRLFSRLQNKLPGVARMQADISLKTVKSGVGLPI